MSRKAIVLVIILFALIVVGMFVYAHLRQAELTAPEETPTIIDVESVPYPGITRIDGTHYYIDGVHTIVGEILFPTPCDLLETNAIVMESFPEQIVLNFDVINNAEMCTQVVTAQRFKVSATASADATFRANFMGREVELNLKPAAEGETPDDFEIFIKG